MRNYKDIFSSASQELQELRRAINTLQSDLNEELFVPTKAVDTYMESMQRYRKWAKSLEEAGAELSIEIQGRVTDIQAKYEKTCLRDVVKDYCRLSAEAADVKAALEKSKLELIQRASEGQDEEYMRVCQIVVDHVRAEEDKTLADDEFDQIEATISKRVARGVDRGEVTYNENMDLSAYPGIEVPQAEAAEEELSSEEEPEQKMAEAEEETVQEENTTAPEAKADAVEEPKSEEKENKADKEPVSGAKKAQPPLRKTRQTIQKATEQMRPMGVMGYSSLLPHPGTTPNMLPGLDDFLKHKAEGNNPAAHSAPAATKQERKPEVKAEAREPEEEKTEQIYVEPNEEELDFTGAFIDNTNNSVTNLVQDEDLPASFDGQLKVRVNWYNERKANTYRLKELEPYLREENPVIEALERYSKRCALLKDQVRCGRFMNCTADPDAVRQLQNMGFMTEATIDADGVSAAFYGLTGKGAAALNDPHLNKRHRFNNAVPTETQPEGAPRVEFFLPVSKMHPTDLLQHVIVAQTQFCEQNNYLITSQKPGLITIYKEEDRNVRVLPMIISDKTDLKTFLEITLIFMSTIYEYRNEDGKGECLLLIFNSEADREYYMGLVKAKLGLTMEDFENRLTCLVRHSATRYTSHTAHYSHDYNFDDIINTTERFFINEDAPDFNDGHLTFIWKEDVEKIMVPARRTEKEINAPAMTEQSFNRLMDGGRAADFFAILDYITEYQIADLDDMIRMHRENFEDFGDEEETRFREMIPVMEGKGFILVYEYEGRTYLCMTKQARKIIDFPSMQHLLKEEKEIWEHITERTMRVGLTARDAFPLNMLQQFAEAARTQRKTMSTIFSMANLQKDETHYAKYWDQATIRYGTMRRDAIKTRSRILSFISWDELADPSIHINWNTMLEWEGLLVAGEDDLPSPKREVPGNKLFAVNLEGFHEWDGSGWQAIEHFPLWAGLEEDDGDNPDPDDDIPKQKTDAEEDERQPEDRHAETNAQEAPVAATIDAVAEASLDGAEATKEPMATEDAEPDMADQLKGMPLKEAAAYLADHADGTENTDAFRVVLEKTVAAYREGESRNSVYEGLTLLNGLACEDGKYASDLARMIIAVNSKMDGTEKTGANLKRLLEAGDGAANQPVISLLDILQMLFAHDAPYDYDLDTIAQEWIENYEENFPGMDGLKTLANMFLRISKDLPVGFTRGVINQMIDGLSAEDRMEQTRKEASELIKPPVITSGLRKLMPKYVDFCFGPGSEIQDMLIAVTANKADEVKEIRKTLAGFLKDGDNEEFSKDRIEQFLDDNWDKALDAASGQGPRQLVTGFRRQSETHLRERLEVIRDWVEQHTAQEEMPNQSRIRALREEILGELARVRENYSGQPDSMEKALALFVARQFKNRLEGQVSTLQDEHRGFITSRYFCLDESGAPMLDVPELSGIRNYEPWRNALRHIAEDTVAPKDALEKTADPQADGYFDNLGQRKLLKALLGTEKKESAEDEVQDVEYAKKNLRDEQAVFESMLETEYAYGRIREATRETLTEEMRQAIPVIESVGNYGVFRMIRAAMMRTVQEESDRIGQQLSMDCEQARKSLKNERQARVLDAAMEKIRDKKYALAEELINRAGTDNADEAIITGQGESPLEVFLGKRYREIHDLCTRNRGTSLRAFGMDYVNSVQGAQGMSVQYRTSSRNLLNCMPNTPEEVRNNVKVTQFMSELGFDLPEVEQAVGYRVQESSQQLTRVTLNMLPAEKELPEYAHPIDIFGTNLNNPVDVIFLFGRLEANDIISRVGKLHLSKTAIVIVNGALDLQKRRQIAEKFHREGQGCGSFLLVDWVLLLHLATFPRNERVPVLLSCTMPFTTSHQPFITQGGVPDEMFIGRERELRQIVDMHGPVVVYGGRQLGKTALLERAVSLTNRVRRREYAILIRAGLIQTEAELTEAIVNELALDKLKLPDPEYNSMTRLCGSLRKYFEEKKITRLWIYIDEADKMLESFRTLEIPYKPLVALSDLCKSSQHNFKFVLAGLHNVYQAANDPNTIIGQFGMPLCIEPLRAPDALKLLTRPLSYLGFKLDTDRLASLLVNTNYYPGIIHHVGYNIVENLNTHYTNYYQAVKNPPYDLAEQQLGDIMSSNDLNAHINQLITWTLEADPCYLMLSRVIGYLFYEYPESYRNGYTIDQIMEYAALLEIEELEDADRLRYESLLNEMVQMGILSRPAEGAYRLRRHRILESIGDSAEDIERKLKA